MKIIHKIHIFVFTVIIAAAGFVPAAADGGKAEQFINGIIEYNLQKSSSATVQEWIDGELTLNAGLGSEWYIIALANYGNYDFSDYGTALNRFLAENDVGAASSRLKYALTFIAIGDKSNPYIKETVDKSIGEQGIMSLVFGLHIINNGFESDIYSADGLVEELLSLQLDDGGWAVTGEYGDVDVTAMTVQALSPYYSKNSVAESALNDALEFLSARQLESGGYSSYGLPNPESAAQVIIALSSMGNDICNDSRFIKNGNTVFDAINAFRMSDGSFCHREGGAHDSTATAQVLCAAVAYENTRYLYVFDDVTTVPETTTEAVLITEPEIAVEEETEIVQTESVLLSTEESAEMSSTEKHTQTEKIILISVCVIAVTVCIVLLVLKKRRVVPVIIITAVLVAGVIFGFRISYSGQNREEIVGTVTITVRCDTVKNAMKKHVPENGIILKKTGFDFKKDDTVFDVLSEICKEKGIHFSSKGLGELVYVEGIGNVYEYDFGDTSGWLYFVNGNCPSVGCGNYKLTDGDVIEWHYTCNSGEDLDSSFQK